MRINDARFTEAIVRALSENTESLGIGTLGEKLLHRILKYYIDPDENNHEIEYLGSVADVINGEGIFEIQTRSLERLVPKLEKFLEKSPVTVVYPLFSEKNVIWFDKQTGELTPPRRSPKRATPADALIEIYKLLEFLERPGFSIELIFLKGDEYKLLDGWDKSKKRGATKLDRIPSSIDTTVTVRTREDCVCLLSDSLPHPFTAKQFYKLIGHRGRTAYYALRALVNIGIIHEFGKLKNAKLFDY